MGGGIHILVQIKPERSVVDEWLRTMRDAYWTTILNILTRRWSIWWLKVSTHSCRCMRWYPFSREVTDSPILAEPQKTLRRRGETWHTTLPPQPCRKEEQTQGECVWWQGVARTSPGNGDFLPFVLKSKKNSWDFAVPPHFSDRTSLQVWPIWPILTSQKSKFSRSTYVRLLASLVHA